MRRLFPLGFRIWASFLAGTVALAFAAGADHDDAELRDREMRRRHGGDPSAAYLKFEADVAAREFRRWNSLMPGPRRQAVDPSIPAWRNLGPTSLDNGGDARRTGSPDLNSGLVSAILTHPADPHTLYLGMTCGGVWRCTNADPERAAWTWESISDTLPGIGGTGNVGVGDLAMDRSDPRILYLGLGGDRSSLGAGFYISHDGGDTWNRGGDLGTATYVQSLLPLEEHRILAGADDGLYRSTDGGTSFQRVPGIGGPIGSICRFTKTDLVVSGMGRVSQTWLPRIWYSSDAGLTWQIAEFDDAIRARDPRQYPMRLATTPASDHVGWGLMDDTQGPLAHGVLRTADKGHTWTFVPSPSGPQGLFSADGDGWQGATISMLAVDPDDADHLFAGANFASYRSLDGGRSWEQLTHWFGTGRVYCHADIHIATWSQAGPKALYIGTDGGLSIFRDPYRNPVPRGSGEVPSDPTFLDNRRNQGLITHLIYYIGSTTAPTPADARQRIIIGMQDNSTGIRRDAGAGLALSTSYTISPFTGDGAGVLYHLLDGDRVIASSYTATPLRSLDGGATWKVGSGILESPADRLFSTPVVPGLGDPTGNTVYTLVTKGVYRSTDFADTWQRLPGAGLTPGFNLERIAVSKSHPDVLAVSANAAPGMGGSGGFLSRNGGASWTPFGPLGIPGSRPPASIWEVWINTFDPNHLYVTSLQYDQFASHLWKSKDGGGTWVPMDGTPTSSNGFPFGLPVYFIRNDVLNPQTLYAGTETGIYRSTDEGQTWARFGSGLPLVRAHDLYQAPDGSFLRLATFGRGAWELAAETSGPPFVSAQPKSVGTLIGLPATFSVTAAGTFPISYQWRKNGLPIPGAVAPVFTIPTVSSSDAATYDVLLNNSAGTVASGVATLTVKSGDLDGDGRMDLLDLAYLAWAYGGPGAKPGDLAADFDADGDVDDEDLKLFLTAAGL